MTKHGVANKARTKACLCELCVEAMRKQNSLRTYRKAMGITNKKTDSYKTRSQIRTMRRKGQMPVNFIAKEVGLTPNHVLQMISRSEYPKQVWLKTAKRVDNLYEKYSARQIDKTEMREGFVGSRLTMLGIQGLQAQGWSQQWIANQLEISQQRVSYLSRGVDKHVKPEVENRVKALVLEVGSKESTDARRNTTKSYAKKNGYVPTIMWDELV